MSRYERIAFICGYGTGAICAAMWPTNVVGAVACTAVVAVGNVCVAAVGRGRK